MGPDFSSIITLARARSISVPRTFTVLTHVSSVCKTVFKAYTVVITSVFSTLGPFSTEDTAAFYDDAGLFTPTGHSSMSKGYLPVSPDTTTPDGTSRAT